MDATSKEGLVGVWADRPLMIAQATQTLMAQPSREFVGLAHEF